MPDRAALCATEIELATDSMVELLRPRLTCVELAVESSVETLTTADRSVETTLETEVAAERTAELDVPSEVPADVIADVDTTLLTVTIELRYEEICVDATVARLATAETPVDELESADTLLEMLVWRPTIWLATTEQPVEAAFSLESAVETAVFSSVTCESTVETPSTAVDSEVDRLVKALRPEETCALVGVAASATMVETAVDISTASEVTLERLVLSRVAPLKAVETTTPAEVVVERAVEQIADNDVWLDLVVLDEVESAVLSERLLETWAVCDV